jgi:flagellar M-ring protein FliF
MAETSNKTQRRAGPWLVAALLSALVAMLIAGYFLLGRRDMATLFERLRPAEASVIVEELDARSIPYELADGGATILVSTEQRDATRLKLSGSTLNLSGQEGLELFDSSDLGLTEFAQRIKYQRAIQGELTRTIMKIDGVLEARIHVSIPERATFRSERSLAKAAVTILTRSPDIETPDVIAGIQHLVAASIADLAPSDVVVLNGRGAIIGHSVSQTPPPERTQTLLNMVAAVLPSDAAPVHVDVRSSDPATEQPDGDSTTLTVTTARPLTEIETSNVLAALHASAEPAIAKANVLFEALPAAPVAPPTTQVETTAETPEVATSMPTTESSPDLTMAIAILAIIGLLAVVVIIALWRRSAPQLSAEDQRRFAARLRLGLQSQNAEALDAAP